MTTNSPEFYVSGIAIAQMFYGAQRLGLPAQQAMIRAGIDIQKALQPTCQVPNEQHENFLRELLLASNDELLGLHIGEQTMPAIYGILTSLAINTSSLQQAIQITHQYQALIGGNSGGLRVEEGANGSLLLKPFMVTEHPILRRHLTLTLLTLVLGMGRMVTGKPQLAPQKLWLDFEPVSDNEKEHIEALLLCPVKFGQEQTMFELDAKTLALPVNLFGDSGLAELEATAKRQLLEQQQQQGLAGKIKWLIRDQMINGMPRRKTVADRLNMSARTLDRRLADEGLAWQDLLDETRLQLAHDYLTLTELTVAEISERLGFSDPRSFQRRFRQLCGKTPAEIRQQLS